MKYILSIIALFITTTALAQATIQASVDKNKVGLGEVIRYSIVATDTQSGQRPNFTPLEKDFKVVSQGQSTQLSIVNNKTTQYTQWIAVLIPKHGGTITIPSVKVGTQQTQPITIQVLDKKPSSPDLSKHVFVENSAQPLTGYVQQQILYTIKLYFNRSIRNPSFNLVPQSDQYIIKEITPNRRYQTTRDGVAYQVLELKYALFPQKNGDINIAAPSMQGYVQKEGTPGAWNMGVLWKSFQTAGKPITLQVKPIPSNANKQWWLPASQIRLTQHWSDNPPQFHMGTPITRTIQLDAVGLNSLQLPDITAINTPGMQTYPDKPLVKDRMTANGVVSSKIFKIAYIPTKTGKLTLPAISVPWWNTETNQAEVATLPAQTIQVLPGKTSPGTVTPKPTIQSLPVKTPIQPTTTISPPSNNTMQSQGTPWFWLANLFFLLWIVTMLFFWRHRKRQKVISKKHLSQRAQQHVDSIHKARNHLKKICMENNPQQAKVSLLNLAHAIWPEKTFLSLGDVCQQLTDEKAIAAIKQLDKLLYTQEETPWDGLACWDSIKSEFTKKAKKQMTTQHPLPELYLGQSDD